MPDLANPAKPPRVFRFAMLTFVALGVMIDAFFAIVNFYPVAPHPDRGPKRYIVMQLDATQAAWFQANVLDDFNAEMNKDVEIIRVEEEEQLQSVAAKYGKDVLLVGLPTTQVGAAIAKQLVHPFSEVVAGARIADDFKDLDQQTLAIGRYHDTQYFLPWMSRLDIAVYRVSKVRDAVLHWSLLRPQIEEALQAINGRGLPAGFQLEASPDQWDQYDLFVAGYFWANRVYDGAPARPRIAHRSGDEIDGQQDIVSALYRQGLTDAALGSFAAPPALDYFQWEALFRQEGIYPDAMWGSEPFDDEALIEGLQSGDVFFASIDSLEAFTLHGGSYKGALPHIADPDDLEFTSLPRGASIELGPKGTALRVGKSFSFREDWVWAVPTASATPALAYELVRFLWRPEIHTRQCEALGLLPQHPQVLADRVSLFRLEWMSHLFGAELRQVAEPIPPQMIGKGYGSVYAQLWATIAGGNVRPVATQIAEILKAPPAPHALAVAAAHPSTKLETPTKTDDDAPATGSGEVEEDWESDVVLRPHAAAKPTQAKGAR
ncbi:hypothetical protein BH11MYX1_BH11MYX1_28030 [soil metagenome]